MHAYRLGLAGSAVLLAVAAVAAALVEVEWERPDPARGVMAELQVRHGVVEWEGSPYDYWEGGEPAFEAEFNPGLRFDGPDADLHAADDFDVEVPFSIITAGVSLLLGGLAVRGPNRRRAAPDEGMPVLCSH